MFADILSWIARLRAPTRAGMGPRDHMQQPTKRKVCLAAGKAARVSVPVPVLALQPAGIWRMSD
jgi:hypothetical protein